MTGTDNTEGSDIFPLLLVLLTALTMFYVLRPPVLLLLDYWFGTTVHREPSVRPTSAYHTLAPTPGSHPIPATPLPASLTVTPLPARWADPLTLDPDLLALGGVVSRLTNDERVAQKVPALREDERLTEIAARHSRDMVSGDYLAQLSNDGDGPAQRVGLLHRSLFGFVRENVAAYDSGPMPADALGSQFVDQWMNSLGHRRNLLARDGTHLGVGCYASASTRDQELRRKCTQLFAQVFAFAEIPVPSDLTAGSVLEVRLRPEPGNPAPLVVVQTDLLTDRVVSAAGDGRLSERGGAAEGQLQIVGPPALYGLSIGVPLAGAPGRTVLVPGPYIRVR